MDKKLTPFEKGQIITRWLMFGMPCREAYEILGINYHSWQECPKDDTCEQHTNVIAAMRELEEK